MNATMIRSFALNSNELLLLLYLQQDLLRVDIEQHPTTAEIANRKREWVGRWRQLTEQELQQHHQVFIRWFDKPFDYDQQLAELRQPENHLQAGIMLLELIAFQPYASFKPTSSLKTRFQRPLKPNPAAWNGKLEYMARHLGYDPQDVERLQKSLKTTLNRLTDKWRKIGLLSVGGLAIGALTLGTATPWIAAYIGGTMGLSGAAATSAGLASIGGLVGGGMASGQVVLVGGGALLGLGSGTLVGHASTTISSKQIAVDAIKLEVVLKEIILQGQYDIAAVHALLQQQRQAIQNLEAEIDQMRLNQAHNEKHLQELEQAVKIMKEALKRNQELVRSA